MVKQRPEKLSKSLKLREKISSKRPNFKRSEIHRFPRLGDKWRSSKGIRSKMRLKKMSRAAIVETGYRGPVLVRGLNASGKHEVIICRVEDLINLNRDLEAVRISATVGKRKRVEILKKADELMLAVVNKRPSERVEKKEEEVKEKENEKIKEKERKEPSKEITEEVEVKEIEEWSAEKEEAQIKKEEEEASR
jgi:large subunit ribosomal protein L32e